MDCQLFVYWIILKYILWNEVVTEYRICFLFDQLKHNISKRLVKNKKKKKREQNYVLNLKCKVLSLVTSYLTYKSDLSEFPLK